MSEHIRQALEREEHNAFLCGFFRPEEAVKSEIRAEQLRQELGQAFTDEMEILLRHEQQTKPEPKPETCLRPLGMDENVMPGRYIYDDQTHLKRPL